ncbi:MAG: ATP-binding protein [Anaerolineae bacterium]
MSIRHDEPYVEIAVADTGYGISRDDQRSMFQKFFRVADTAGTVSGTGLGLAIQIHRRSCSAAQSGWKASRCRLDVLLHAAAERIAISIRIQVRHRHRRNQRARAPCPYHLIAGCSGRLLTADFQQDFQRALLGGALNRFQPIIQ